MASSPFNHPIEENGVYFFPPDPVPPPIDDRYQKILENANRRADSNQTVISGEYTDEVLTAKMLQYCIRMLHADGWVSCSALRRHETDISSTLQL